MTNTANALKAYSNVGMESSVASADPHKLILLLYQGALLAIASAKNQILRNETAAKGASISHAIAIIDGGLKASLNLEQGGDLARNLSELYIYMTQQLVSANLNNDTARLDEISQLLIDLRTAWESIRPNQAVPATQNQSQPVRATNAKQQATLVYGRM